MEEEAADNEEVQLEFNSPHSTFQKGVVSK